MARRIRIMGLCLCIAIVVLMFVSIGIVDANVVRPVKNVQITKISDHSAALEWDKVKNADGYCIYQKHKEDSDFVRAVVIDGKKNIGGIVDGLQQAKEYDFYVVGYKNKHDVKKVGEKYKVVSTIIRPSAPAFGVESIAPGQLHIYWDLDLAEGYELKSWNAADETNVKSYSYSCDTLEQIEENLAVGSEYSAKIRSYITFNGDKVYSPWSSVKSAIITDHHRQSQSVDPTRPMIALTFDDGPGFNGASDRILDILEEYNIKATFFMVGKNAENNPDNVRRKLELGMEIGNHTYNHDHYGKDVTAKDIQKSSQAIFDSCGAYPTVFRSPGGQTTKKIRVECEAEGMPLFYWTLDTRDWKSRNAKKIYKNVINNVSDGDIILMHEIYNPTADALDKMIPKLIKEGYQFVTCTELVKYKSGCDAEPGQQYLDGVTIKNETK